MTNAELEKIVETSDEWIISRTGIRERHYAADNQDASDLALEACKRALHAAHVRPDEIDMIVVATSTPDMVFPATACILQDKLGIKHSIAFDIQAVCSVCFCAGHSRQVCAQRQRAMRIGGRNRSVSRILNWQDRSTCVLFGDGAGAAVVRASNVRVFSPRTCIPMAATVMCCARAPCKTAGARLALAGHGRQRRVQICGKGLRRSGRERIGTPTACNRMKSIGFICHQANQRIIMHAAKS